MRFAAGFLSCLLLIAAVGALGRLRAGETWIVGTVASYHTSGDRDKYEQQNWGLGIEQRMTEAFGIVGGVYRNSHRRDSLYFGMAWAPLKLGFVRLGAAAMLVGGYESKDNDELLKAVFPVVSIEYHGFGVNIPIVPKTKYNEGVIGLQLKMRF